MPPLPTQHALDEEPPTTDRSYQSDATTRDAACRVGEDGARIEADRVALAALRTGTNVNLHL